MATVEIKVTYDPSQENLERVLSSLLSKTESSPAPAKLVCEQTTLPEFTQAPEAKPVAKAKKILPEAPAPEAPAPEAPAPEAKPSVSKTDIRALAVKLSTTDTGRLLEILKSVGARKLSEVPEDRLEELYGKLVAANA